MKKTVSILLLLAMLFSLCACAKKEETVQDAPAAVASQAAEEAPAAEPSAEPTASPEEQRSMALELFHNGNYSEAFPLLEQFRDSGDDEITELLGLSYYYGYGTEAEADTAVSLLGVLADKGSLIAKLVIAEATYIGNGAARDPELADKLFEEIILSSENMDPAYAHAGSIYAALVDCYAKGKGCDVSVEKAKAALEKAFESENMHSFARTDLAKLLEGTALGAADIPKSNTLYSQARESIEQLAEIGNVKAVKVLGDYYFSALAGYEQDYDKAMELYLQAADENNADAQAQIGYMYQNGCGVETNYEQAMEWNNRAAQQGNAQGQAQIGYLYHMGLGVTQNLDEAGRWYSRAADQGDPWATAKLAETEITNPQIVFEFHA